MSVSVVLKLKKLAGEEPPATELRKQFKEKCAACTLAQGYQAKEIQVTRHGYGGGKSKAKGNDFERVIAKQVGMWWWGKDFRRVPNSGGWDKQCADGQVQATGDIYTPPESKFPFSIECKKYNMDINFLSPCCELWKWWKQCCDDARTAKKIPLLIYAENNKEPMAAFAPACVGVTSTAGIPYAVVTHPGQETCKIMHLLYFLTAFDGAHHDNTYIKRQVII